MKSTVWFISAIIAVIIGYDIYAYLHAGLDATISRVIYTSSRVYPVIPFIAGGLAWHLFGCKRDI